MKQGIELICLTNRNIFSTTVIAAVQKGDRSTIEKALKNQFPKENTVLKDITTDVINETTIKQEPKWSDAPSENSQSNAASVTKKDMPPPALVPLKKKKIKEEKSTVEVVRKSARTKGRKKLSKNSDKSTERPSDVVIQEPPVPTVDLDEEDQPASSVMSEDSSVAKTTRRTRSKAVKKTANSGSTTDKEKEKAAGQSNNDKPVRSTRTKTIKKSQKRSVSGSPEKSSSSEKKANDEAPKEVANLETTFTKLPDARATFKIEPSSDFPLNSTIVVENPKLLKDGTTAAGSNASNQKKNHQNKVNGDVFSPVRSKVNAYEELIKKRTTPLSKAGAKATSPMSRLPVVKAASSKPNKYLPSAQPQQKLSINLPAAQSNSAMKASLAEMKERQKQRQVKEMEALRKKEALLQAQMEEKRKKREEKQLKAQQQREQLERERSRTRADQINKVEEKTKKIMAVKEEKLQHFKELQEKKRQIAKERHQNQVIPNYLTTPLPLLPSDSPYDSDDERYTKKSMPSWAKDDLALLAQCQFPDKVKNTFFCRKTHTPDVLELFEVVDPKRTKRTSSAVWDKAPSYSILHVTQDIVESSDSS
ncbi:unnamed protein product [Acanthoscelides obtectus]|uniref:Inner centromere protein ARK-binding domain-containing protein n=1 Tax=Acanthoscelides obtectus TaxID=200917 RepID=A0A9P0KWT4_ACAOB|nr:unnamed protein product [Acanthoscelides obtectus]CAK1666422.1 hypothetical protein AOBTE_LOCUS25319 [Acanthoscelides obtectus]